MSLPSSPIKTVADTAYWVAACRAIESERPDAYFHDPYARLLAGERGQDMLRMLPWGTWASWAVVVRTCVFDELILRLLQQEEVDLVLNLGAGFDMRPYRLSIPACVRWIEIDLPEIVAEKEEKLVHMHPVCALERVRLDLADKEVRWNLFWDLNVRAKRVLVITEGLLVYLTPGQVSALAHDLHTFSNFCYWLTDLISPAALQAGQLTWKSYFTAGNSRMQFAPAEGEQFFVEREWRIVQCCSAWEEAERLPHAVPFDWFFRWVTYFQPEILQEMYRRWIIYLLLQRE